jgi:hypothetical protein
VGQVLPVIARTGTPEDKRRVWPIMTAQWPEYDKYQAGTKRDIRLCCSALAESSPGLAGSADDAAWLNRL